MPTSPYDNTDVVSDRRGKTAYKLRELEECDLSDEQEALSDTEIDILLRRPVRSK